MRWIVLIILALAAVWFFRVQILSKVLGQPESRIRGQLNRRKR